MFESDFRRCTGHRGQRISILRSKHQNRTTTKIHTPKPHHSSLYTASPFPFALYARLGPRSRGRARHSGHPAKPKASEPQHPPSRLRLPTRTRTRAKPRSVRSPAMRCAPPRDENCWRLELDTHQTSHHARRRILHRCANTLALLCATRSHIAHPRALSRHSESAPTLSLLPPHPLSVPSFIGRGHPPAHTHTRSCRCCRARHTHTHIHTKLPSRAGSVRGDDSHLVHAHCTHQPIAAASPPPAGAIRRSGIRVSLLLGVASL